MCRILTSLLAIFLIVAGLAAGMIPIAGTTSWQPAFNLSNTPGRSIEATLAQNPLTGDLFVAWTDDGLTTWEEIVGRRWDGASQMWLPTENLSLSEEWQRDGGPLLIFDEQGHGLLIWTRTYSIFHGAPASGYDVLWRSWNGATWSPEAILFHGDAYLPGSPGTFGLIPVKTSDSILLFITWGNTYRTTEYRNNTWTTVTPWAHLDPSITSLAQVIRDQTGLLHAAAYGENSAQWGYNPWFYDAYYLTYDGTSWSEPLNLSSTDGVANSVGMAFDRQGRLHFLWSDPNSLYSDESLKSALWERIYDQGVWSPNTEVTLYNDNQAINGFSLTTDEAGMLHLAWSEGIWVNGTHTNLGIYYQTGDGTVWGPEEEVYTSVAESRYPVLVADGNRAAIVWREGLSADSEVYFSHSIQEVVRTYLPLIVKNKP